MHVWHRQENEPPIAYAQFIAYCLLGPERTLVDAWCLIRGVKRGDRGVAPGDFNQKSVDYDWVERSAAYDDYITSYSVQQTAQNARKILNRAQESALKCIERMDELLDSKNPDISLREYSGALSALAGAISKMLPMRAQTLNKEDIIQQVTSAFERGDVEMLTAIYGTIGDQIEKDLSAVSA